MATKTVTISGNPGTLGVTLVQPDNSTVDVDLKIYVQTGKVQSLLSSETIAHPASGAGFGTRAVKVAAWPGATTYQVVATTSSNEALDVVLSLGTLDGVQAGAFSPGPPVT